MLNWWCITWPVGFKRLKEHHGSLPRSQQALYQPKMHSIKYNKIQITTYIRFMISMNRCVFRHRTVRCLVDTLNVLHCTVWATWRCLQKPATYPYSEPTDSSPRHLSHLFKIHFNIIPPSKPGSSEGFPSFRFLHLHPSRISVLLHACYMTSPFPSFNGTLKSFYRLRQTEKNGAKKEMSEDEYGLLPSWTQSNML